MSRLPHLGWSSHVYPLEVGDFASVPDYDGEPIPSAVLPADDIVLFIRPNEPDVLLRGRARIVALLEVGDPHTTIPVRIVFRPSVSKWNLLSIFVRLFRNRFRFRSTGVYHISAARVREMRIERAIRTLDNPQLRKGKDRTASMRRLEASLRARGYDDARPINVMLCRTWGNEDSIRQGHHRISACLFCGVDRMAVTFSAAGALSWGVPMVLVPVLVGVLIALDALLMPTACSENAVVEWGQFGCLAVASALMISLTLYDPACRGVFFLISSIFVGMAIDELDGIFPVPILVVCQSVLMLVAVVCAFRWRRMFRTGCLALHHSRFFMLLPVGLFCSLVLAEIAGCEGLWRLTGAKDVVPVLARVLEESLELLGDVMLMFWTLLFAWMRTTLKGEKAYVN